MWWLGCRHAPLILTSLTKTAHAQDFPLKLCPVGGRGRQAGGAGDAGGAGWGGGGAGPAHPIYTILSVSILKKMLDGFYMKIMDLTIQ